MQEAVVVASSRTPLAKSFRGFLNLTRPDDMLAHCFQHVLGKAPEPKREEIEDIIVGCRYPEGAEGKNVARVVARELPHSLNVVTEVVLNKLTGVKEY